jgi:hypothetical protein
MSQFQQEFVATAIEHYGLDLEDEGIDTVVLTWFQTYDPAWVVKALVEALYRGRYKVKSVDNILRDWQRRGSPLYRFTPDYEREILHSLRLNPDSPIVVLPASLPAVADRSVPQPAVDVPPVADLDRLDPEEAEPFQHHERAPLTTRLGSIEDSNRSTDPEPTAIEDWTHDPSHVAIPSMPDRSALVSQPGTPDTKLHLFHKLREIVDPNDRPHHNIQRST